MPSFDLRSIVLIGINILKSFIGSPSNWDAFDIIGHLTWPNFISLAILILLFTFTSIKIPLFDGDNMMFLHIQFGEFLATFAVSFVASLILPQAHYWVAYSLLIFLSFYSTYVLNFFVRVQASPSIIPRLNVFLRGMVFFGNENQEVQGENQEIERQSQEELAVEYEITDIEQGQL